MGFYRPPAPLPGFTVDLSALARALIPVADREQEAGR